MKNQMNNQIKNQINRKLRVLILLAMAVPIILLSACGSQPINLLSNNLFTDQIYEYDSEGNRGALIGLSDWEIFSPLSDEISIAVEPTESSGLAVTSGTAAVKITISSPKEGKRSYFYFAQRVKVQPNTVYCFSYKVKLSITTTAGEPFVYGVYPTILEDKILELPEMHTDSDFAKAAKYSINRINTTRSTYQNCSFYFNSNSLSEVTLAVWMGSPESGNSGVLTLNSMSLTPQLNVSINSDIVYIASANKGYSENIAGGVVFVSLTVAIFIALFIAMLLTLSYSLAKKRKKAVVLDFEMPENVEMMLSEASVDSESVEIKFDKNLLVALYEDEPDTTIEMAHVDIIANSTLPRDEAVVAPESPEVSLVEVDTVPAPNKVTTAMHVASKEIKQGFKYYLKHPGLILASLLTLAFIVRVVLAVCVRGFRPDLAVFYDYLVTLDKFGLSNFYTNAGGGEGSVLGAGTLYMLELSRLISNLFGVSFYSPLGMLFLKLFWIIADILAGYVLFYIARKFVNKWFALSVSALYLFNPAVFIASAGWGQADSLYTLFLLLTFYSILQKKSLEGFLFYTLALLFSANALFVLPIFLTYYIYRLDGSLKFVILEKDFNALKKTEGQFAWRFFAYLLGSVVLLYLLSLPAMFSEVKEFYFFPIQNIYYAVSQFNLFSQNSFNFFTMLGRNGTELEEFPAFILALVFWLLIACIVVVVFMSKRNRANLVLLGAYSVFAMSYFLVDTKPSLAVPYIALLALALVAIKDSRIMLIYGLSSLFSILNQGLVLFYARNITNLSDNVLTEDNPLFTGSYLVQDGSGFVTYIVFSALTLVLFAYFTYCLLELGLAGRRKKMLPLQGKVTLFTLLKSLIK